MEATAWLLFEIGGLLAFAGIIFFCLGWWAKGNLKSGNRGSIAGRKTPEVPVPAAPDLANQSEQEKWHSEILELRAERDRLLILVTEKHAQTDAAPPVKKAAKPRARKTKK